MKQRICKFSNCQNTKGQELLWQYECSHPKPCKLQPPCPLTDLYPYIKSLIGKKFSQWKKEDIDAVIKFLKGVVAIECFDASKEVIEVYQQFYIEWHSYLEANPLVKRQLDPVYVWFTFWHVHGTNRQETLNVPQGFDQIIMD